VHDAALAAPGPYERGWAWQRAVVEERLGRRGAGAPPDPADDLIVLQHAPVYTLGTGSDAAQNLRFDPREPPAPLFRTERGGEVTFHGPGQLVLYPILDLAALGRQDLHWYTWALEETVIRALSELGAGADAGREPGAPGVWVGPDKVAALGVRCKRWLTYHGVAVNVVNDLAPFDAIVPCGLVGRGVCSVGQLLARAEGRPRGTPVPGPDSAEGRALLARTSEALLAAFADVFELDLLRSEGPRGLPEPSGTELLLKVPTIPSDSGG